MKVKKTIFTKVLKIRKLKKEKISIKYSIKSGKKRVFELII